MCVSENNATHIKVPDSLTDEQVLFLGDIFPTGWQAAVQCDIEPTLDIGHDLQLKNPSWHSPALSFAISFLANST